LKWIRTRRHGPKKISKLIELWQQTAVHMSDGHYQLPIPFKTNRPAIQNNKSVALFRLQLLKKKLDKDAALKKKCTEFMEDMVLKGYTEKLPCHDERGSEAVGTYLIML
jgi:hypothetical protein